MLTRVSQVVNTVNFSNHTGSYILRFDPNDLIPFTGYGCCGGTKTSAEELALIFDFMQQTGVLVPDRFLTGYVPNAESLGSIHELVKKLRISNPNLVYLLDRES